MDQPVKVGAVVLAAGASTRFGQPKQLAIFNGESLVEHAVTAANSADCAPIVVVAGAQAAAIAAAVAALPCAVAVNHDWSAGLASSIRTGLQHLLTSDHDLEAILFLACDQPLVSAENLRGLIAEQQVTGKPIVASAYANTLGIPALFTRAFFPELLTLAGDRGAKRLFLSHREEVAAFSLPAAATDIDTISDYARLLANE
ncbi:MAG: nucleotidyltransferase family protein [Verrucomicrobiota bacterium]|nr:nucleotidyltransferase family protein [Verrucomicrobiota bacterium]